jgi:hypothetical protein|tara:strand:- start:75 stop:275 length:201 start_codon:yes stop_codon:yes gene_type:complete
LVNFALENKNGEVVKHIVMVGELGYKIYKTPEVIDLVFDTKEQAQEVGSLLDVKVIEYFYEYAQAA